MNIKIRDIIFLILVCIHVMFCQSTFVKTIKVGPNFMAHAFYSIIKTMDNNYVAIGTLPPVPPQIYIVKFDINGNILLKKRIPPSTFFLSGLYQTQDKGYIIISTNTMANNGDWCLIKLDSVFNIQWSKIIGGANYEQGNAIIQTKDGGYLAVGSTNSFGLGGTTSDIYVVKLDSNGNFLWSKTYGGLNMDSAFDIVDSDSITHTLVGHTMSFGAGGSDFYLVNIDSLGNILWTKTIGGINDELFYTFSSVVSDKGDIIINGESNSYPVNTYPNASYIFKTTNDSSKILKWAISFERKFSSQAGLCMNSMNEYIGVANYPDTINNTFTTNGYAYNISSSGTLNWVKKYNGLDNLGVCSYNTGYFFCGSYETFQQPEIHKTNQFGESCIPTTTVAYKYVGGMVGSGGSITSVNQGTIANFPLTIIDDGIDSTVCFCPDIPLSITKNPVNCFGNGSATITPANPGNYFYTWNPPVSSTNSATNLNAGNYTITISDTSGCQKTFVLTIPTDFSLNLSISGKDTICSGQYDTLSVSNAQSITWNTGQITNSIIVQPSVSTTYSALVVNGSCIDSLYFTVVVNPTPTLTLSSSSFLLNIGDTAIVSVSGATSYSASPSNFSYFNNNTFYFFPKTTSNYCITGETNKCYDSLCLYIKVDGTCFDFIAPNIFTPNNDNINDWWYINFKCPEFVSDYTLHIYNRWGVLLFESNKPMAGWDGRSTSGEPAPTGTYYYTAEFTINNKQEKLKGYFTLLR